VSHAPAPGRGPRLRPPPTRLVAYPLDASLVHGELPALTRLLLDLQDWHCARARGAGPDWGPGSAWVAGGGGAAARRSASKDIY
jgi:hypothetical protein